jgi:hypothetical protein
MLVMAKVVNEKSPVAMRAAGQPKPYHNLYILRPKGMFCCIYFVMKISEVGDHSCVCNSELTGDRQSGFTILIRLQNSAN